MKQIEVKILNPGVVAEAEQLMVAMARMTQKGHTIDSMESFEKLLAQPYSDGLVSAMTSLPHPTIQKFGAINIAVVGASRRFLAQITRHQNEIKFMSGSLQYSNYSGAAKFVVPYEITEIDNDNGSEYFTDYYLTSCAVSLKVYENMVKSGIPQDAAGYVMPQGMRNVLLMSATPYQFKHMISQRTCNRNTLESQYVMGLIWEQLYPLSDIFHDCGPFCTAGKCPEGKMTCGRPYTRSLTPTELLDNCFPVIRR